ncbi:MAG: GNAT family N-acetyltransferase [Clostridiales bacterium]|nr:GNAT family N-acetyltransferase [Clostridiales bacterium]
MSVKFRNYTEISGITEDYFKVREFFVKLGYKEYTFARWDWMTTHGYLDKSAVGKIGLWEDDGEIVGIATIDCSLGDSFCLTLDNYQYLKKELLLYAKDHLGTPDKFGVIISDEDDEFQRIAAEIGFIATESKENDAIFWADETSMAYELPEGFSMTSMKDTYDLFQYGQVLWRGFNHELNGEGAFKLTPESEKDYEASMMRPNVDLDLKVAVVAPSGDFVSYCGMWYDSKAGFAVIEPVATDPAYRKMGLGKAAVLEGIKRVAALGAKKVLVGSSQQFYYSLGMRPYKTATRWICNK